MAGFTLAKGDASVVWMPKKASVAMAIGDLLYADGSGAVQLADATSGQHLGVCMKTIASTDSDYASTTSIPLLVPQPNAEWDVAVGTGTAAASLVGTQFDLKDANEVDVSATSKNVVTCTAFISTTKVRVKINAMIDYNFVATS